MLVHCIRLLILLTSSQMTGLCVIVSKCNLRIHHNKLKRLDTAPHRIHGNTHHELSHTTYFTSRTRSVELWISFENNARLSGKIYKLQGFGVELFVRMKNRTQTFPDALISNTKVTTRRSEDFFAFFNFDKIIMTHFKNILEYENISILSCYGI